MTRKSTIDWKLVSLQTHVVRLIFNVIEFEGWRTAGQEGSYDGGTLMNGSDNVFLQNSVTHGLKEASVLWKRPWKRPASHWHVSLRLKDISKVFRQMLSAMQSGKMTLVELRSDLVLMRFSDFWHPRVEKRLRRGTGQARSRLEVQSSCKSIVSTHQPLCSWGRHSHDSLWASWNL